MPFDLIPRYAVSVVKEAIQLGSYEPPSEATADLAERQDVFDFVAQDRAAASVADEVMAVIPEVERAADLGVGKQSGRIVFCVLRNPTNGQAQNSPREHDSTADS
jgi:hypothetical protein